MSKSIITMIIALVLVLSAGICEVVVVRQEYEKLQQECQSVLDAAKAETLTQSEFDTFYQNWHSLRELSELFLPHLDVYELNLRVAESKACLEIDDMETMCAQMEIVNELLQYVPHMMTPSLRHIF